MTFGEFAKLKRLKAGYSQSQIAKLLSISHSAYANKERGIRKFSTGEFIDLVKFCGVLPEELWAIEWETTE